MKRSVSVSKKIHAVLDKNLKKMKFAALLEEAFSDSDVCFFLK
jgi:hypothetical protein